MLRKKSPDLRSLPRVNHYADLFPVGTAQKICDSVSLLFVEVVEMLAKSTDGGWKNRGDVRCSDHLHVCHVAFCSTLRIMKQTELKAAGRLGIHGRTVQRDDSNAVAPAAQTVRMRNSRCVASLFMKFS